MRLPATADACLKRYVMLKMRLSAPKSIDLEDREASFAWASRCSAHPKCKSRSWASVWDAKAYRSRPRCVRCGRLWVGAYVQTEGVVLPWVRSSEPETVREMATYTAWFRRLGFWEGAAWGLYVLGKSRTQQDVADECRRRWPEAPFAWNKDRVWRLVKGARECVEERLAAARMEWEASA